MIWTIAKIKRVAIEYHAACQKTFNGHGINSFGQPCGCVMCTEARFQHALKKEELRSE